MNLSRILFVEDEKDILAIGRMVLEMVGKFTVHTCGSGVASLPRHASVRDLLVSADQALYRAKRKGKNRIVVDVEQISGDKKAVAAA